MYLIGINYNHIIAQLPLISRTFSLSWTETPCSLNLTLEYKLFKRTLLHYLESNNVSVCEEMETLWWIDDSSKVLQLSNSKTGLDPWSLGGFSFYLYPPYNNIENAKEHWMWLSFFRFILFKVSHIKITKKLILFLVSP